VARPCAEPEYSESDLKRMLSGLLAGDRPRLWGKLPARWIAFADNYFWDDEAQRFRIEDLERYGYTRNRDYKVLDVGAGCGQFVRLALTEGYDCRGIEPEAWKLDFARRKARFLGMAEEWGGRIKKAVGESIPFDDSMFDVCTTYQTLEHVQDPGKVLEEMLRVTRTGGGLYLRCPDYRSTFEGHYQLPWMPLFPRGMARMYLRLLGRPADGLDTIQYVTRPRIMGWLHDIERKRGWRLFAIDDRAAAFQEAIRRRRIPYLPAMYDLWAFLQWVRQLGRQEMNVNLFIKVLSK
jgi:SAM-dependent methyltransferase